MDDPILSFNLTNDQCDTVFVEVNDAGIQRLMPVLDILYSNEGPDPFHLVTPSHGSDNAILTEGACGEYIHIHKVMIFRRHPKDIRLENTTLSFEVQKDGDEYILVARVNNAGIMELKETIDWLLSLKETDHNHMMTPAWGGSGLTEDASSNGIQVHHVKMGKWVD